MLKEVKEAWGGLEGSKRERTPVVEDMQKGRKDARYLRSWAEF